MNKIPYAETMNRLAFLAALLVILSLIDGCLAGYPQAFVRLIPAIIPSNASVAQWITNH